MAAAIVLFVVEMFVSTDGRRLRDPRRALRRGCWPPGRCGGSAAARCATSTPCGATLAAVAEGARDVRTGVTGNDEIARLAADVDAMVAPARRRGARPAHAVRRRLARPAHADHRAAAAGQRDRRRRRRRRHAPRVRRAHEHARARARRADRRPVRAHPAGERRADVDDAAGPPRPAAARDRRRDAPRRRGRRRRRAHAARRRARGRARQPRAAPARAVQPDPERDPPHAARRQRDRQRARRSPTASRSRSPTPAAGSAPEHRERVFDPFYRADPSRRDTGAGLGLAISRAIVEAHGGQIWLEDAPVGHARALPAPGRRYRSVRHSMAAAGSVGIDSLG